MKIARLVPVLDELQARWAGRAVLALTQKFGGGDQGLIDELEALGARVAAVVNAGPPEPGAPVVEHLWTCAPRRLNNMEFDAYLADPPQEFADWLRTVDPAGDLTVLGNPFTHVPEVLGRRVYGWRRPRWAALEDKTAIDAFWQSAAVPAPPHAVLPVDSPDIADHFDELRGPLGAILAMDSTRTYVGNAEGLRWVRSVAELATAVDACRGSTDRIRLASFLPGVPCSILGMVLERGVAVFDPIEIVTLRDAAAGALVFCGSSTAWRPGFEAIEEMRRHVRRAGLALREDVGFRGFFSVDGIWGAHGFSATELNPRHASGLGLRTAWPRFPAYMFQRAVQEGDASVADVRPDDLELALRPVIRAHPSLSVRVPAPSVPGRMAIEDTVEIAVAEKPATRRQVIRYRARAGAAALVSVEPALPDGTVGPAAAALARELGATGLTSFRDDQVGVLARQ